MLYRQVKVSERLPDKTKFYETSKGRLKYAYFTKSFFNDNGCIEYPWCWYEEVKEPADEEIERMASSGCYQYQIGNIGNGICEEDAYTTGFDEGFKKALELLKGK